MIPVSYRKELDAMEAFTRLLAQVEQCRALFDEAGMDYPPSLKRMLSNNTQESDPSRRPQLRIDPPPATRPAGVPADWISVPKDGVGIQNFVLANLRDAHGPVRARDFNLMAQEAGINAGSIANSGKRLEDEGLISRTSEGWTLIDSTRAPVLNGENVWGPREIFNRHEIAARRRNMIMHLLGYFPEGLQTLQILARMQDCDWVDIPINKDLLKMDMEELREANKVRRISHSKKWGIVE